MNKKEHKTKIFNHMNTNPKINKFTDKNINFPS